MNLDILNAVLCQGYNNKSAIDLFLLRTDNMESSLTIDEGRKKIEIPLYKGIKESLINNDDIPKRYFLQNFNGVLVMINQY